MRIFPQLIIALCVLLPLASGKSGHRSVGSLRGRSNVVSSKGEAAEIPQRRALKKVKSGKKNIFETREGEEERDDDEDTMSSSSSSSNDDRSSPSLDDRQSAGRDFGRPDDLRRVDGGTGGARAVNQPTPAPSTPPPILSLVKLYQREQYGALRRVTEPPTPSPRDVEDAGGGDTSGAEVDGEGTTGEDNGEEEEDEEREGRQSGGVDCSLNANGFFGVPTGSVYEVEYLYQVYVVADTSLAILRSQIMPSLDIAVAESILPAFFDCNNARRDRRYLQDNRVEAVSSRRPDEVVLVGCTYCRDAVFVVLPRSRSGS